MELSFKDKEPEPVARTNGGSKAAETPAEEDEETEKQKPVIRNSRGLTVVQFPHDPDDLVPLPRPPPRSGQIQSLIPETCISPIFSTTVSKTRQVCLTLG